MSQSINSFDYRRTVAIKFHADFALLTQKQMNMGRKLLGKHQIIGYIFMWVEE